MATAKTETLTAYEFDVINNQEVIRELTQDEISQREIFAAQAAAQQAKAAARQSALAKLAELGLTEEEIQAL